MAKRVNVMLADSTVRTIDRLSRRGQRSRFIERAVRHYLMTASPEALKERLKAAAVRDRDLDSEIARDWAAVDQEQWQELEKRRPPRKAGRNAGKSTSRRSIRP